MSLRRKPRVAGLLDTIPRLSLPVHLPGSRDLGPNPYPQRNQDLGYIFHRHRRGRVKDHPGTEGGYHLRCCRQLQQGGRWAITIGMNLRRKRRVACLLNTIPHLSLPVHLPGSRDMSLHHYPQRNQDLAYIFHRHRRGRVKDQAKYRKEYWRRRSASITLHASYDSFSRLND